jgi:hypothetical protein
MHSGRARRLRVALYGAVLLLRGTTTLAETADVPKIPIERFQLKHP